MEAFEKRLKTAMVFYCFILMVRCPHASACVYAYVCVCVRAQVVCAFFVVVLEKRLKTIYDGLSVASLQGYVCVHSRVCVCVCVCVCAFRVCVYPQACVHAHVFRASVYAFVIQSAYFPLSRERLGQFWAQRWLICRKFTRRRHRKSQPFSHGGEC